VVYKYEATVTGKTHPKMEVATTGPHFRFEEFTDRH